MIASVSTHAPNAVQITIRATSVIASSWLGWMSAMRRNGQQQSARRAMPNATKTMEAETIDDVPVFVGHEHHVERRAHAVREERPQHVFDLNELLVSGLILQQESPAAVPFRQAELNRFGDRRPVVFVGLQSAVLKLAG